jgi:hypothetical protein
MARDNGMSDGVEQIAGVPCWVCGADGPPLASSRAASDIIGDAFGSGARTVAIPVERLSPDFVVLRTGLAGEVLQKFVNYGFRVAITGDISAAVAASDALRDFVRECNRGAQVWFVADRTELERKLAV